MIGRFACVWDWSLIVPQDVLFGNISCFAPDYVFQEMGLLPNRRQLKRQEEPKARRGVTHHQPSDVRRKPPQTRLTASRQHSGPVVVNPIASVSGAPLLTMSIGSQHSVRRFRRVLDRGCLPLGLFRLCFSLNHGGGGGG